MLTLYDNGMGSFLDAGARALQKPVGAFLVFPNIPYPPPMSWTDYHILPSELPSILVKLFESYDWCC